MDDNFKINDKKILELGDVNINKYDIPYKTVQNRGLKKFPNRNITNDDFDSQEQQDIRSMLTEFDEYLYTQGLTLPNHIINDFINTKK